MRRVPGGSLPTEIDDDGSRQSRRKTHIVDNPLPAAVRHLRFHVRRHRLQARLPRGIHGTGRKILDEAVQQQAQGIGRVPLAQIERERVLVGEAGKGQIGKVANVMVIARAQQLAHIATLVIPCSGKRMRLGAENRAAGSKRGLIQKALVGVHLGGLRMVDRNQPNLVEKVHLFHRFPKTQAEISSARAQLRAFHLDPLIGIGIVFCRGRNPVTNDRGANHIGDEFISLSVPGKQRGAGASPAVQFREGERSFCCPAPFHPGEPRSATAIRTMSACSAVPMPARSSCAPWLR